MPSVTKLYRGFTQNSNVNALFTVNADLSIVPPPEPVQGYISAEFGETLEAVKKFRELKFVNAKW